MKCLLNAVVTIIIVTQCAGYNSYDDDYEDTYKYRERSYNQRPQDYVRSEPQYSQYPEQQDSVYKQKGYGYQSKEYSPCNPENKQSKYPSDDEYDDDDEYENLPRPYYDLKDAPRLFQEFKRNFHKQYKNAQDERVHFEYFMRNLKAINDLNAEGGTAVFAITLHADRKPSN